MINEYFYQLTHYGALRSWTDAIYQLSGDVGRMQSPRFVVDDWGIDNPLLVLSDGRLPIVLPDDSFVAPLADDVWIGHTSEYQQVAGVNEKMVQAARSAGFEKRIIETVPDRNGHPVFEIFRFVRAPEK